MAGRLLTMVMRQTRHIQKATMSTTSTTSTDPLNFPMNYNLRKIGKREVVGYGSNGEPIYIDCMEYPMPAIRYKEVTPEIQALREKEKGDWRKLSIDEKKALYRASFRQTFAELNAHTGHWKSIVGMVFFGFSLAIWWFLFLKTYVLDPLPVTFDREHQLAQLERMRVIQHNPITGIGSRYK